MSSGGCPLFSIVIPAFNAGPFIESALQSVAAQTFRSFEVIVVDDGSTDETLGIARQVLQQSTLSWQVVSRPDSQPKGVAAARNHGIHATRGSWVAFLDADDLLEPNKLERCALTVSTFGTEPGVIHHGARLLDDKTGQLAPASASIPRTQRDYLLALLEGNFVTTSTVVVHRTCLEETDGFDTRLNGVEDYWLWIRIAKRREWRYIAEPLTRYRHHDGSLMRQRSFDHYVTQFTALLAVAEASGELSAAEMAILRRSVLDRTIRYFAGESARHDGLPGLFPGALRLARTGYAGSAASLIYRHFRAQALRWIIQLRPS